MYPPSVLAKVEIELSVMAWPWWWNSVCGGEAKPKVVPDSKSEMLFVGIMDVLDNDSVQELNVFAPPDVPVVSDGVSVVIENNGVVVVTTGTDPVGDRWLVENDKKELFNEDKGQPVFCEGEGLTD